MGLLDDAIREHLELKRSRGADESEVEREEREALGPPRRGQFADEPDADARPGAVAAGDLEDEAPLAEEPASESELELAEPPQPPEELTDAPPEDAWLEDEREDDVAPAPPPPRRRPDDEQAAPEAAQRGEEDVLEGTPEFLQETPEHDRLWFEQKPPRTFDWDK